MRSVHFILASLWAAAVIAKKVCYSSNRICVDVVDQEDSVDITITSTALGWASVGINTVATMSGADVMIGWINDDGSATLSDRKAIGYSLTTDSQQDLTLLPGSGRDNNGLMTLHFQRLKDTGDANDMVIKNEAQYWIFATSDEVPSSSSSSASVDMHDFRAAPSAQNLLAVGSTGTGNGGTTTGNGTVNKKPTSNDNTVNYGYRPSSSSILSPWTWLFVCMLAAVVGAVGF